MIQSLSCGIVIYDEIKEIQSLLPKLKIELAAYDVEWIFVLNHEQDEIRGWISQNCNKAITRPATAPAISPLESRVLVIVNILSDQWQGNPVACRVSCVEACRTSGDENPATNNTYIRTTMRTCG